MRTDENIIFQRGMRGKLLHNKEPYFLGTIALLIYPESPRKRENRDMGVL
jgi:hypothetical protein